ncbi:RHS domain-containing protein [Flavisolibacter sp. BT320]|nr:RHS domain-containing protein [Flavisolibacter longurius]
MSHDSNHNSPPEQPEGAYRASRQSIQGAGANVQEARDSVKQASAAISNLVSGEGNIVDAAMAVKGAFDNVKGLSGRLSATAAMPVMKALAAFKGQATMPAGKQMDPVMGIDVHMVTIPPAPAPVPMPHPFIAVLFNTKDWVSCLINTFKKESLDQLPEEKEGENSVSNSLAKNKAAIADIAMGLAGLSASVKFGGIVPRAITGTQCKTVPHIPMGAGFHPGFQASVKKNHGKAFLGSLFVVADGDPMVGSFHLNYNCWDVGAIDLFKSRRAGAKKAPPAEGPQAELFVPSGTVMPIPWGRPVLVNSIPTPINPLAFGDRLFKAGLGKLKKLGRRGVERVLTSLRGKVGCRTLTAVSRAIGTGQSHPVDVSGGYFYTDNEDVKLPGPIPLVWERVWYSNSNYNGPLGYGWHHSYDMALAVDEKTGTAVLRMADGRPADFHSLPIIGKPAFNRSEKLFLHLHEEGFYYVTDKDERIYRFTQKEYKSALNGIEARVLQSISNRAGFAIRFAYNESGLLKKIIDSAGRNLKVSNDERGRITLIEGPDPRFGGRSSVVIAGYEYTEEGDLARHADALEQPMLFEYQNHLMVREVWRNGLTWQFRYNKSKGPDAKCVEVWGDDNLLHYTFDYTDPNCTLVTNSLRHQKLFYHKNGVVTKYVDPNGAEWTYRYNRFNELEAETDPLGNQTAYAYDEWGNRVATTDPGGAFVQTEFYHPQFRFAATGAVDAAGGRWKWSYDAKGAVRERVNPLGAKTVYRYEDGLLAEIVSASEAITRLAYDAELNLVSIQTDDGATTLYAYDVLGNCTEVVNPNGVRQKRFYDVNGRMTRVLDFDGNDILLDYDGLDNVVRYRDKQKDVRYTYKGLWKLTSRTEAGATIGFLYDTEEQLRKVVNEHGLAYHFQLDPAGNVSEEIGFDNIARIYERNAASWVTKVNRPGGRFTQYGYDPCGRVTEVAYSDGSKEAYVYRADGDLLKAVNDAANVQFDRDVMGNIVKESVNGEWIVSAYDAFVNRVKTTSSLGADITHQYNQLGDVIQTEANGWSARFGYDKLGLEVERILQGNVVNKWQRDGIGRPVLQEVGHKAGAVFNRRKQRQYTWDVNDRLKQIRDEKGVTRFEHDQWSNLAKTVFPNGEEQLRNPDAVGNLYQSSDRKDRVYAAGGQLKKAGRWTYHYDAEGNLVKKEHVGGDVWLYEWNGAGMLTKVVRPDKAEVTFAYDALGRRLWKRYKNTTTKFVWDGNVPLHEWKEHAVTGEKLSDVQVGENGITTWLFDTDSFSPCGKIKGNKKYSIVTDHLGTPTQMYYEDGNLFWEGELDSYGKVRMEKGEVGSCPFRYQGQYEDVETGLYYNRFRYYSIHEGFYLSQDPIRYKSGELGFYNYVRDSNIWVDFLGLNAENVTTPIGQLRDEGRKDAHHVIQDAAVRDLPGYDTEKAPGVQLSGPSTQQGSPHYNATQAQRGAGGGTYAAERRIAYRALRKAGLSKEQARQAIHEADRYFRSIGVGMNTQTRIPGNRKKGYKP